MAEQSIRSLFESAEHQRKDIEASWDSNTATYQENLVAAISTYEDCLKLADRLSLFSPNETLEDLTSGDIQYVNRLRNEKGLMLTLIQVSCHQLPPCGTDPPSIQQESQSYYTECTQCIRKISEPA